MRVGGGEINLVVNLDFFARRSRLPTLRLNECAVPEFRDILQPTGLFQTVEKLFLPKRVFGTLPSAPATLRLFWRQLGHQLRPFAFDDRTHLIRDVVNVWSLAQILVQPLEIGLSHYPASHDARIIEAVLFGHLFAAANSSRTRPASADPSR